MVKKWYLSKMLWVNIVAILAIVVQGVSGKDIISPEIQAIALSLINLLLRVITHEKLEW